MSAAAEKPLFLIVGWIASTRVDLTSLDSGGICLDGAALVVSSILEAFLENLLPDLVGQRTTPAGASLELSGIAAGSLLV